MVDKRCFVQFSHPGREAVPDPDGTKGWNKRNNDHARKFMAFDGQWIEEDGSVKSGELNAWGEWEPESDLVCALNQPFQDRQYPRYLWHPYYVPKHRYMGLHNTDPFIFGDRFLYSNCGQLKNSRPSGMARLKRGSVIAFGSGKTIAGQQSWILDTVMVVADSVDYEATDALRLPAHLVSETFLNVTGGPIAANEKDSFKLYIGAPPDDPVDGMFSFFPAMPSEGNVGFPRPQIDLPSDHFNPRSWRGPKGVKRELTSQKLRVLWKSLVAQVHDTGLVLGTYASLPEQRV